VDQLSPLILGLTGGIASGKSTALKLMKRLGAHTIDADILARRVVAPGTPGAMAIRKRFGNVFYGNGRLNRPELARIVFKNTQALKALNAIVHPLVLSMEKDIIRQISKRNKNPIIVVDATLMIESGSHVWKDAIIVIACSLQNQIKRLHEKRGFSKKEALIRIKAQMPLNKKIKYADYVIDNNGSFTQFKKDVTASFLNIADDFQKKIFGDNS
jgi:dephospho-CoA kinase